MTRFLLEHLGEAAALGTATCWVFSSLAFSGAVRRLGPVRVNVIRIIEAAIFVCVIHRLVVGHWIPRVDGTGLAYLAVSGLIGFALGDQFLFQAFADVGPRLTTLLMTTAPPVAAVLAWLLLHETLGADAIVGMFITLAGISWVALEQPDPNSGWRHVNRARGLILGCLASVCQAIGLILSKIGIGHTRLPSDQLIDPWSASLVRLVFGAISICVMAAILKRLTRRGKVNDAGRAISPQNSGHFRSSGHSMSAYGLLTVGCVLGPVVGVWCSLVAVDRANAAVAATLMAMTPVFILPFAVWVESERVSWSATIGAVVAVTGVAILTGLHRAVLPWPA